MPKATHIDDIYDNIIRGATDSERMILDDIFRAVRINRRNLSAIIKTLNEYVNSLNLLEIDYTERKKVADKLVHPIDFSEIFSYMYKEELNSAYGNMVDYSFKNIRSELHDRFFAILPGTVYEIINHLEWLTKNVKDLSSKIDYDKLLRSKNIKRLRELYRIHGTKLKQEKISFEFKWPEELSAVASDIGMEKENYTPLRNLYNLINIDNKIITPLEDIKPERDRNIEEYKDLYEKIRTRLSGIRKSKIYPASTSFGDVLSNNAIDAQNLVEVFSLNDTYVIQKEYYNLITRDLPAGLFREFTWSSDPLIEKVRRVGKGLPLSRYTQYVFYSVYIDNHFEKNDIDGINEFISELKNMFSNSFESIITLIDSHLPREYVEEDIPPDQMKKDRIRIKRKLADTITRYFEIDLKESEIDLGKYINFAKAIESPEVFDKVMSSAKNHVIRWATETKNSLRDHLSRTEDPLVEECYRSLEEISK